MQHVIEQKPNTNVKISLGNTDLWIFFLGGIYLKLSQKMSLRGTLVFMQSILCLMGQPNFSS